MSRLTTLTAVHETLKSCSSPHTKLFTSLLENGKNSPLKCTQAVKARFGATEAEFVHIGKKPSPFTHLERLPSAGELRDILLKELRRTNGATVYFPPPSSDDKTLCMSEEDAAVQLLSNLQDTEFQAEGIIPGLPCPSLDDMCSKGKEDWEAVISVTPMTCSVFPSNSLIALQHHNETTSFSTLLTGKIVWMIWPPSEHNLGVLQQAYEEFAKDFDLEKLEITQSLLGGVAFVQDTGDGLRVPPFCIMQALATKTSVIATYSVLTAYSIISLLCKLPLLESWWKTEVTGEQQRANLGHALLHPIQLILAGSFEFYPATQFMTTKEKAGPLHDLLQVWPEVMDGLVDLLDVETAKEMKKAWKDFLVGAVGRNCALCGRRFQSKTKELGKHFDDSHWPKARDSAQRVDSLEAVLESEDLGSTIEVAQARGDGAEPVSEV